MFHWRRTSVLGTLDQVRARRYQRRHRRALARWAEWHGIDAYGTRIWIDWARSLLRDEMKFALKEVS